jgi:hypothetical protein
MMSPTSPRFYCRAARVRSRVLLVCRSFPCSSRALLPAICVCALVASGCAERNAVKAHVKSIPWAATARKRPVVPQLENASYQEAALTPDLTLEIEPPPSPLVLVNSVPARPRVPVSASAAGNAPKFEPPTIVPQLTTQETEAAQQQTNLSLSIAERNVGSTRGRTLNAAQSDLVSKVRSFVTEAREAAHNGDWTRASNAAKKAQVLSEELARTL